VVHRDLKPDNIFLIDPDDQTPETPPASRAADASQEVTFVKIMDFGIAKSIDNKLTGTGMTVGTPEYMSPEQATGERVDHRTDQYSMGCILYEMLTGFIPFEGQSAFEIMNKHLNARPVPPRQKRPDRAAEISEGMEQIVLKLMAKDRAARFPNMKAVELALHEQEAALLPRQRLLAQRTLISPPPMRLPAALQPPQGQQTLPLVPALPGAGGRDPEEEVKTRKDLPVMQDSDLQRQRTRVLPAVSQTHELIKKIGEKVRSRPSLPEVASWQRLPVISWVLKLWYRLRSFLGRPR
jgi:serine/threonine protein kinase